MEIGDRLLERFYRKMSLGQFNLLGKIPNKLKSPIFCFCHIYSPHDYSVVFDKNGNVASVKGKQVLAGIANVADKQVMANEFSNDFRKLYCEQMIYINKRIMTAIELIISNSRKKPIIVLQSDHGYKPFLSTDVLRSPSPSKYALGCRLPILNAYFLPEEERLNLYRTITPINTFRMVLNHCFNLKLKLLDDICLWACGPSNSAPRFSPDAINSILLKKEFLLNQGEVKIYNK